MSLEALRRLPNETKNILRAAAQEIKRQSQGEVPHKTWTLHDACEVVEGYAGSTFPGYYAPGEGAVKRRGWFVKVRYRPDRPNFESGAFTGDYMMKIHEYPPSMLHHDNGKYKFLEDPYRRVIKTIDAELRVRLRRALRSGGNWPGYEEYEGEFKRYRK